MARAFRHADISQPPNTFFAAANLPQASRLQMMLHEFVHYADSV